MIQYLTPQLQRALFAMGYLRQTKNKEPTANRMLLGSYCSLFVKDGVLFMIGDISLDIEGMIWHRYARKRLEGVIKSPIIWNKPSLTKFINLPKVIEISMAHDQALILCEDGSVYALGMDGYSQTGRRAPDNKPRKLDLQLPAIAIASGNNFQAILLSDGFLLRINTRKEVEIIYFDYPIYKIQASIEDLTNTCFCYTIDRKLYENRELSKYSKACHVSFQRELVVYIQNQLEYRIEKHHDTRTKELMLWCYKEETAYSSKNAYCESIFRYRDSIKYTKPNSIYDYRNTYEDMGFSSYRNTTLFLTCDGRFWGMGVNPNSVIALDNDIAFFRPREIKLDMYQTFWGRLKLKLFSGHSYSEVSI